MLSVVTVLTVVLVLAHGAGVVGDLLASLDPANTGRGVLSGERSAGEVATEDAMWAGVDGAVFFLALAVAALAIALGTNRRALRLHLELLFQSVLVLAVVLVGCGVAFTVGALLAFVDTGLLLVVRWVDEVDDS